MSGSEADPKFRPPLMSMFTQHRFTRPLSLSSVAYFLYLCSPLAFVAFWGRLILSFLCQLGFLLLSNPHDRTLLRTFFRYVNGWRFNHHGRDRYADKHVHIIVGNHVSELDGWLFISQHDYMQVSVSPLYWLVAPKFNIVYLGKDSWHTDDPKDRLRHRLTTDKRTLIAFSEGGFTNGRVGLLAYSKFVYSLPGLVIQPVAIRMSLPVPIELDTFGSHAAINYFFIFTCPYITFDATYLPPMEHNDDDDDQGFSFARRVQEATAEELGIIPTTWLYKDKLKLSKETYG